MNPKTAALSDYPPNNSPGDDIQNNPILKEKPKEETVLL